MASKPTGKPGDKWARIGNAVPPKMMQAIAECVKEVLAS
jgi:site-specific DNA-cytosine methylase